MESIRLKKAFPGHYEGQVISVDPVSASVLITRGEAEAVVDEVDAESPSGADAAAVDTSAPAVLTRQSSKPDLIEFAIIRGWTREQAESSTRAQIADTFGLE